MIHSIQQRLVVDTVVQSVLLEGHRSHVVVEAVAGIAYFKFWHTPEGVGD